MGESSGILRIAARCCNPFEASQPGLPGPEDEERVARCLVENRVPLVTLDRWNAELAAREPFASMVEEHRRAFSSLRAEYGKIAARFGSEGIETLLLKSCGLEPSFPYLFSNLDVLVERARGDDARKLLYEQGYVELLNVEEPGKFLFRRFVPGFSYTFHLHEEVGWGVPFLDARRVWEGRVRAADDPELVIPGAREALLVTIAHWFYEDKELTLANLFATARCVRLVGGDLEELAEEAAAMGWKDGFYGALWVANESWKRLFEEDLLEAPLLRHAGDLLENERFLNRALIARVRYGDDLPAKIPFLADKVVYYRKVLKDPRRRLRTRLLDTAKTLLWAVRWKLHIRSQKPMLVALSGCDGSGKSEQTRRLSSVLSTCDIRHRILWARGGSSRAVSFLTRPTRRLLGGTHAAGETATESYRLGFRRKRLGNPLTRFLYSWIFSIDLFATYVLKASWYILLGNVVICDRHVLDGIVDFMVSSGHAQGVPRALKLAETLAPRPSLHFLLDVKEEEALRRKPSEGAADHIAQAREFFLDSSSKRNMSVLEHDLDMNEAAARIASDVLERFYAGYGTVSNALLFSNPEQLNPGRWRRHPSKAK